MSIEGTGAALPVPTSDERTMSLLAHAGGIFFGFIPALVIYLTKGNESPFVRDQSREALNFQISVAIGYVVSFVLWLILVGILLTIAIGIGATVLAIMAAIASNNGQPYRYPVNIRFLK
jgi:uncharacterized protein